MYHRIISDETDPQNLLRFSNGGLDAMFESVYQHIFIHTGGEALLGG